MISIDSQIRYNRYNRFFLFFLFFLFCLTVYSHFFVRDGFSFYEKMDPYDLGFLDLAIVFGSELL